MQMRPVNVLQAAFLCAHTLWINPNLGAAQHHCLIFQQRQFFFVSSRLEPVINTLMHTNCVWMPVDNLVAAHQAWIFNHSKGKDCHNCNTAIAANISNTTF